MRIINNENGLTISFLTTYKWVGYPKPSVLDVQRFHAGLKDYSELEYSNGMYLRRLVVDGRVQYCLDASSDLRVLISENRAMRFCEAIMGWMTRPKKGDQRKPMFQAIFSGKVEWTPKDLKCTEKSLSKFLAGKNGDVPITDWYIRGIMLLGRGSLKPGTKNINEIAKTLLSHLKNEDIPEETIVEDEEEEKPGDAPVPMLNGVEADAIPEYDDNGVLQYTQKLVFEGDDSTTSFTATRTSRDIVNLSGFEFCAAGGTKVFNDNASIKINVPERRVEIFCPSQTKQDKAFVQHMKELDTNQLFDIVALSNGDKSVRTSWHTRKEELLYIRWPAFKTTPKTMEKRINDLATKYGALKSLKMHEACAYVEFEDERDGDDCYEALKGYKPTWLKEGTLSVEWARRADA